MTPIILETPPAPSGGSTGTPDCPVLANGLVRVRYDASVGYPGFRVDLWTGSAYVEQGKLCFLRKGGVWGFDDTLVSAGLREWTPERAVMECVLRSSADPYSREEVFVTLQRGWRGARFECYPAPMANGNQADAMFVWTPAGGPDANDSVFKSDSQASPTAGGSGVLVATAGSGSALFGAIQIVGAASFASSENFVALLRFPSVYNVIGPYQHNIVVLQAGVEAEADSTSYGAAAYGGSAANDVAIAGTGGLGYVSCRLGFAPTVSDQVQEAETIRNTGSATTSQVSDSLASGGLAVKDTQASNAAPTLLKATTNLLQAKYRIMARCHSDGGAASFQASLGATSGSVATQAAASWTWTDLGDILAAAAGAQLEVSGWGGTLAAPTGLTASLVSGGSLSLAPYWWQITALNAQGETIGSSQVTAAPTTTGIQAVLLAWNTVTGATGYKIYRATTSGGESTSPALVTTISSGSTTSYTDTGVATTTGAVPASNTATYSAYIDRAELVLMEDRARSGAQYVGARDQGLAALSDSRQLGAITAR